MEKTDPPCCISQLKISSSVEAPGSPLPHAKMAGGLLKSLRHSPSKGIAISLFLVNLCVVSDGFRIFSLCS